MICFAAYHQDKPASGLFYHANHGASANGVAAFADSETQTGYRPQFFFRTTDVTGSIKLPEGVEMVMPGDNVEMEVELITPIAIEAGLRFAIREGGHTVGAGAVVRMVE